MTGDTRQVHEHVLSLLDAAQATAVLDVGCGGGEHLRMLASMVPGTIRLVGVDKSEKAIEAARAAADGDPRFRLLSHDVSEGLPFEAGEFDRVLSVNTLEAIPSKNKLVREIHRVMSAEGRVVCAHYDWESQLYDGVDKAVVRKVVRAFADWKLSWMADVDGWMGRRLWRTFQASGLFSGHVDAYTHTSTSYEPGCYGWQRSREFGSMVKRGMITEREYHVFIDALGQLAESEQYFFAITMFSYVGVRPSGRSGPAAPRGDAARGAVTIP